MKIINIEIENQTIFQHAKLTCSGLNVIIGENGSGKSHLLKMIYSILAVSAEEGRKPHANNPTKILLQTRLADKLINVFRPEILGHLVRRKLKNRERCKISAFFDDQKLDIQFSFASQSRTEVVIDKLPSIWLDKSPVFLPTKELLTIYPNFLSVYENHYIEFDEIYRDTCIHLGTLPIKHPNEKKLLKLLQPLEQGIGGKIKLDKNGRFYLIMPNQKKMEMPLVAEGSRKLAMLIQLIVNGVLLNKGYLFWDEPEAELNPRLLKLIAETIFRLCENGIQVFIATHSLFLLRELEIIRQKTEYKQQSTLFFALEKHQDKVTIEQGNSIEEIDPIVMLDETMNQSDRYVEETWHNK
jgi:predicted ATPase